ncbi:MAG: nucleotide pyrophosphohydrolase [Deltaproteobacteria bacterium]|nr:nucleotide pyrophosphohydrolase [Deltaproteobacteria bacterium]
MNEVLEEIRAFVAARNWEQFHDPKNLAMAVASEAGELAAELRWVPNHDADAWCRESDNHARVRDEIADVAITLTMLADRVGVDLAEAMRDKLIKNGEKYPVDRWKGQHE